MTIAWVFPGQGSQKLGMCESVIELPGARERFEFASKLLGRDLYSICKGENIEGIKCSDLNDTRNTQPALFVVESLLVDCLRKKGNFPSLVAGHSLGEIVALYAAEVFDMETAFSLLKCRSELMASSGGGAMTAVLGFERSQLEQLVNETSGVVIANDNSATQVVLSGTPEAVNAVSTQLKCKRAIPLQVSGPFHSPFMEDAANDFSKELDQIEFKDAIFPVLSNADPTPTSDGSILKQRLKKQMTTGVRWRETMDVIDTEKIKNIVEIGPGNVLSGIAKRSLSDVVISQISSFSDFSD